MSRMPAAATGRQPSPFRLNLEQQRKRAKELLAAARAGEAGALDRIRRQVPQPAALRLATAQQVIARELGLASWPRLVAHVEALERSWRQIQVAPPPDTDLSTLHIRCGSDIAGTLTEAGFTGDFLEYSDALCQGPVLERPDWLERRADFLAESYGGGSGMSRDQLVAKLAEAEARLQAAAGGYERIVLWFEHDSYDQLILARCLAQFAATPPRRLELISPGRYPGGTRFIGLGQLPPEALRLLWAERAPVAPGALAAGQAVWAGLRAAEPHALAALALAGTPDLPQLGRAVRRHCQELPARETGLGLTERLILEILAEGPRTLGEVYRDLMLTREPLPWMTDLMILFMMDSMKKAQEAVFTGYFEGGERAWPKERLAITPLGRAVLAGEVDWLSLSPPPRWLGGVRIPGRAPCWRWDEAASDVAMA